MFNKTFLKDEITDSVVNFLKHGSLSAQVTGFTLSVFSFGFLYFLGKVRNLDNRPTL